MATIPWILSLADDFDHLSMVPPPPPPVYFDPSVLYGRYPHRQLRGRGQHPAALGAGVGVGVGASKIGKDGFQVCMDVGQFKPSELNVKVVGNDVVVEGKHEEREDDHGYISRHFVRRYSLPKGYDAEKVASTLSSDGVLTVSVPKPLAIADKANERVVQIQQVGPAHLNVKENPQEEIKDKENDKA